MDKYDLIAPHLEHHHPQNVERRLRERIEGLLLQHHQDSTELRALCAARDEARAELAALRARIDGAATGEVWKHDCIGGQSASHIVVTREAADGLCPFGRVALVPLDDCPSLPRPDNHGIRPPRVAIAAHPLFLRAVCRGYRGSDWLGFVREMPA